MSGAASTRRRCSGERWPAARALRHSAAPGLASIVTVSVTILLRGVLIPVLQATSGKNEQVREELGSNVPVAGFYCVGEIAPMPQAVGSEFHNATIVAL